MTAEASTVDRAAVRRALRHPDLDLEVDAGDLSVRALDGGINDVFAVEGSGPTGDARAVVKFGTFSTAAHFRAGAAAVRLLDAYTALPVPAVHAFEPDPAEGPPFLVLEYLPGDPLTGGFADERATDSTAVRTLGAAIREFAAIPRDAADGYGAIQALDRGAPRPRVTAAGEHWGDLLVAYGEGKFEAPPDHDALRAVAPAALAYLREHGDRLPSSPPPSVVVTDLSPGNLLAPDGTPPDGPEGLTGVLDLERAKVGPLEFTAVNAEYLLTRYVEDPEPVRAALYDPLPFGPAVPNRDLYRLVAIGRCIGALDLWYEGDGRTYRERGETMAREIREIVA